MSLLIGFLPGVGSPVRQASLCSTHHSTLGSVYSLALSPSLSLSFPSALNPSLSLPLFLPPVPSHFSRTLSRTSTPFRLLPRPPPYPPNESAPTGALLASLSNPRVRLVNTRTYTHIHARRSGIGRRAVTHATGGFSLPLSEPPLRVVV